MEVTFKNKNPLDNPFQRHSVPNYNSDLLDKQNSYAQKHRKTPNKRAENLSQSHTPPKSVPKPPEEPESPNQANNAAQVSENNEDMNVSFANQDEDIAPPAHRQSFAEETDQEDHEQPPDLEVDHDEHRSAEPEDDLMKELDDIRTELNHNEDLQQQQQQQKASVSQNTPNKRAKVDDLSPNTFIRNFRDQSPNRVITEEEFKEYYEKFCIEFLLKREEDLLKKRREKAALELAEMKDRPTLMSKPNARKYIPLMERTCILDARKARRLEELKQEKNAKLNKELQELTFKPKINERSRSICSPNKEQRSKTRQKLRDYSPIGTSSTNRSPFKPKINQHSEIIAREIADVTYDDVVERLYFHADHATAKKEDLVKKLTPRFTPALNKTTKRLTRQRGESSSRSTSRQRSSSNNPPAQTGYEGFSLENASDADLMEILKQFNQMLKKKNESPINFEQFSTWLMNFVDKKRDNNKNKNDSTPYFNYNSGNRCETEPAQSSLQDEVKELKQLQKKITTPSKPKASSLRNTPGKQASSGKKVKIQEEEPLHYETKRRSQSPQRVGTLVASLIRNPRSFMKNDDAPVTSIREDLRVKILESALNGSSKKGEGIKKSGLSSKKGKKGTKKSKKTKVKTDANAEGTLEDGEEEAKRSNKCQEYNSDAASQAVATVGSKNELSEWKSSVHGAQDFADEDMLHTENGMEDGSENEIEEDKDGEDAEELNEEDVGERRAREQTFGLTPQNNKNKHIRGQEDDLRDAQAIGSRKSYDSINSRDITATDKQSQGENSYRSLAEASRKGTGRNSRSDNVEAAKSKRSHESAKSKDTVEANRGFMDNNSNLSQQGSQKDSGVSGSFASQDRFTEIERQILMENEANQVERFKAHAPILRSRYGSEYSKSQVSKAILEEEEEEKGLDEENGYENVTSLAQAGSYNKIDSVKSSINQLDEEARSQKSVSQRDGATTTANRKGNKSIFSNQNHEAVVNGQRSAKRNEASDPPSHSTIRDSLQNSQHQNLSLCVSSRLRKPSIENQDTPSSMNNKLAATGSEQKVHSSVNTQEQPKRSRKTAPLQFEFTTTESIQIEPPSKSNRYKCQYSLDGSDKNYDSASSRGLKAVAEHAAMKFKNYDTQIKQIKREYKVSVSRSQSRSVSPSTQTPAKGKKTPIADSFKTPEKKAQSQKLDSGSKDLSEAKKTRASVFVSVTLDKAEQKNDKKSMQDKRHSFAGPMKQVTGNKAI